AGLGKLTVFRGGFEREAAEQVAGASLRTLSALVDKSLLQVSAEGRYDLHELMRQYSAEHLEATGEVEAVRHAHARYFADFMQQREDDLKGRRLLAAVKEIGENFDNVRTAWLWAVAHRDFGM